jgi:hypothetical protein
MERSAKYIHFGDCKLLTTSNFNHEKIQILKINKLLNLADYSYFCVKHLHEYVNTEFCLLVQPDGFVTNPLMWDERFLEYDYIGAPWDVLLSQRALQHSLGVNISDLSQVPIIVGNGGFSLRSKRLLEACSELNYNNINIPEDSFICITNRDLLKKKGMKFAPVNIAVKFAIERPHDLNWKHVNIESYFGVHGYTEIPDKQVAFNLLENFEDDLTSVKIAKRLFN